MAINALSYQPQTIGGNSFIGVAPATGITLPIYSATAQKFGLWNPQGSSKDAYLIGLDIGFISNGTLVAGNVGYTVVTSADISISAYVASTPLSARLGYSANGSQCRFIAGTAAGTATITAPTTFNSLGQSSPTTTAANGFQTLHYDFFDAVSLAPETAIFVCANVATTIVCNITLRWYEQ